MKKSTYLGFLILSLSLTLQAQQTSSNTQYLVYSSGQVQQVDFTDFNTQLVELDLRALPNTIFEAKAGVSGIFGRYMSNLTLGIGGGTNESADITSPSSQFRYVGIHFNEALNCLNPSSSWFLGPDIGFNIAFQQIFITGKNNSTNFVEAANNAVYRFERFTETSQIGLRTQKIIQYNDIMKQARMISIGLHIGYQFDLKDESFPWRLNSAIRQNNLGINTGGWFGAFTFGFNL